MLQPYKVDPQKKVTLINREPCEPHMFFTAKHCRIIDFNLETVSITIILKGGSRKKQINNIQEVFIFDDWIKDLERREEEGDVSGAAYHLYYPLHKYPKPASYVRVVRTAGLMREWFAWKLNKNEVHYVMGTSEEGRVNEDILVNNLDEPYAFSLIMHQWEDHELNWPGFEQYMIDNPLPIRPQPKLVHPDSDFWEVEYEGEHRVETTQEMESWLLHDIYGNEKMNTLAIGEVKPKLINGIWYWTK